MDIIIKCVGVLIIFLGIAYLLKPGIMKLLLRFINKGSRIYLAALLRFILAVVFLLGANECDKKEITAVIGVLFLLGGLLIMVLGPKRIRPILDWYDKQPDLIFRIIAVIVIAFGGLIIYSA